MKQLQSLVPVEINILAHKIQIKLQTWMAHMLKLIQEFSRRFQKQTNNKI